MMGIIIMCLNIELYIFSCLWQTFIFMLLYCYCKYLHFQHSNNIDPTKNADRQTIKTWGSLYHVKKILCYIGMSQIIKEYKHEHHNKQNRMKNKNNNELIMFHFLLVVFVFWLMLFYNHQACKANIWCRMRHKILISSLYDVLMLLLSLVVMMLILMQYSVMHNK